MTKLDTTTNADNDLGESDIPANAASSTTQSMAQRTSAALAAGSRPSPAGRQHKANTTPPKTDSNENAPTRTLTLTVRAPQFTRRRSSSKQAQRKRNQDPRKSRTWVPLAAALALIIGLGTAVGVLHARIATNDAIDAARTSATQSASTRVPQILSYSYTSIDANLATALADTTGSFKTDLQALDKNVVRPTAISKKVVTKTIVAATSVVQAHANSVDLLIFTDQTSTAGGSSPQIADSRLAVTMTKVHGSWLVSALKPI
jgi:Mce-associated membrane protein